MLPHSVAERLGEITQRSVGTVVLSSGLQTPNKDSLREQET